MNTPTEQSWSAEGYANHARFVSDLAGGVFEWLAPKAGESILDLGCGDGALTEQIAATGASVVGIDSSQDMVEAARGRGLDAQLSNAVQLSFDTEFDAVFSNAALHWVPEANDVARGVARALKPGGRFVAEFGGFGNVAAIVTAMMAAAKHFGGDKALAHPWYFPAPEEYGHVLQRAGFSVDRAELIPRPTPLPTGIEGWLSTFRAPFFDQFHGAKREEVLAFVVDSLRPSLCGVEGGWIADYVRLRVEARLSGANG